MSYLQELVQSTRARIEVTKIKITEDALEQRIPSQDPAKDFEGALRADDVTVIAEIKRRSPSKGPFDLDLDAAMLAKAYAAGGAAAISVLTEPDRFEGALEDLEAARTAGLPVLRKDFIVDPFQVMESRAWGADSILLIVRALGDELESLARTSRALGMEPIVEVHDENELERALNVDARMIGINHRNLDTFEVDPGRTAKLAPQIPNEDRVVIALSGVSMRAEVEELAGAGARSVLVGESLVTADDPAAKLRELLGR
jgi:indole-3-glycerol phosphate synthase